MLLCPKCHRLAGKIISDYLAYLKWFKRMRKKADRAKEKVW